MVRETGNLINAGRSTMCEPFAGMCYCAIFCLEKKNVSIGWFITGLFGPAKREERHNSRRRAVRCRQQLKTTRAFVFPFFHQARDRPEAYNGYTYGRYMAATTSSHRSLIVLLSSWTLPVAFALTRGFLWSSNGINSSEKLHLER